MKREALCLALSFETEWLSAGFDLLDLPRTQVLEIGKHASRNPADSQDHTGNSDDAGKRIGHRIGNCASC